MNGNAPDISVVMPVYNGEKYLEKSLESIINQSFTNFELIVIDDGSSDGSLEIMQDAARADDRIVVHSKQNEGIVKTLNLGVSISRGEFVARMDADDFSREHRFALQIEHLRKHPECAAVGGFGLQVDQDGDPIGPINVQLEHPDILRELYGGRGSALIHSAAMFRKKSLDEAGPYRFAAQGAEDLDLYLRLAETGTLENIPDEIQLVTRHAQSVTSIGEAVDQNQRKARVISEHIQKTGRNPGNVEFKAFWYPKSLDELERAWSREAYRAGYYATGHKYFLSVATRNLTRPHVIARSSLSLLKILGIRIKNKAIGLVSSSPKKG